MLTADASVSPVVISVSVPAPPSCLNTRRVLPLCDPTTISPFASELLFQLTELTIDPVSNSALSVKVGGDLVNE